MPLQPEELRRGFLYKIRSRNLAMGVYNGQRGFVGIREKFDSLFLFTEYLNVPSSGMLGTVTPEEELEPCPIEELRELLGSKCQTCDQRAWFVEYAETDPRPEGFPNARGEWRCDGGCEKTKPVAVVNRELYDWLIERERANSESFREYHDAYLQGEEAVDAYKERHRAEYWAAEPERVAQRQAEEALSSTPPSE
jgi:hypothetical protein